MLSYHRSLIKVFQTITHKHLYKEQYSTMYQYPFNKRALPIPRSTIVNLQYVQPFNLYIYVFWILQQGTEPSATQRHLSKHISGTSFSLKNFRVLLHLHTVPTN